MNRQLKKAVFHANLGGRKTRLAAALLAAGCSWLGAGEAHAQAGVLLYVPNNAFGTDTVSRYTVNADGTLTAGSVIATGASTSPVHGVMRGDQAYAYVSNNIASTLHVIDTATGAIVQTVAAGNTPRGVAISADGSRVYVANNTTSPGGNSVTVYSADGANGQLTLVTTIATGAGTIPRDLVVSPDGTRVYVANQGNLGTNGSVGVIDTATNTVVTTLATGGQLTSIAMNPAGTRVYIPDTGNIVRVIDTATNTQLTTIATGNLPLGVTVSPDGRFFYVANANSFTITQYDAATNTAVATFATGTQPRGLAISPDGRFLYGTNTATDDNVRAFSIDPATGALTFVAGIAAGNDPNDVVMCGNGSGMLGTGGTFRARSAGALGCFGGTASFNGGTLLVETAGLAIGIAANLGAAGGTIDTNGNDTTVSSAIVGPGDLTKAGAGTLILTGNNSYNGTTISGGTLQIGDGGLTGSLGTGSVTNDGTLAFNRSNDFTVANDIGGSGNLVKLGAGVVTLTGNNAYTGTTTISAGTLQVGAGGAAGTLGTGAVTNDGALVFNRSDSLIVGNAIAGAGTLTQAGSGTIVLTGNNGYSGTTTIAAGTLQVGNGGTSGSLGTGVVTNNGVLRFARSDSVTVANAIVGSGSLEQAGAGTTVLTGANTYAGATTISSGTLQVGAGGTAGALGAGNVANNGALVFNRSDAVTIGNAISGSGSLAQAGAGTLALTGSNAYTGGTSVNAGTLAVNGSIVGNTMVNGGGTLGGSGTVGSVTVASGGTLAPGNSIGTLTANGNLTFAAGSTYRVEADASGAVDRVNATGTLSIGGGTVDVQASGTGFQRNTRYTILSAAGGRTGTFDSVTSNLVFLTPSLVYDGNFVLLDLQASTAADYTTVARTANQRAVAGYLNTFANAPTNAQAAALIQQIDGLTADQARAAFDSMAGSPHASASQVALALGRNFSASLAARTGFGTGGLGNAMTDWSGIHYASVNRAQYDPVVTSDVVAQAGPARGIEPDLGQPARRAFWVQALGSGGRIDSDGNGAGSRYRSSGFAVGYDQPVTGQWLAGAALGYSTSWWSATSGTPASGKLESPQGGVYARYSADTWRLRMDATYSGHDFTTDRTVSTGAASAVANSTHDGREWGLAAQYERPFQAGDWQVKPLAGLRYARLNEDGFAETGNGSANLTVAERTSSNTLLSAGVHFVRAFNAGKGGLELRAVVSHLAGDVDSPVTASIAGQAGSFTANGAPLKRDALTLGATVTGEIARNVSGYLDANYETRGSGQSAYQVTGGVRVAF